MYPMKEMAESLLITQVLAMSLLTRLTQIIFTAIAQDYLLMD